MSAGAVREAVVLAGGLGTRLRSVYAEGPKPLAPIAGRPFLDYLLTKLAREGVRRAILSVGYKHEQIVAQYGNDWNGLELVYEVEETPAGTGGAIFAALRLVQGDRAFALNGDTLLDADYAALAGACAALDAPFGMFVRQVPDSGRYGACLVDDGRLTGFAPGRAGEPAWINAGVYCLAPAALDAGDLIAPFSLEADWLPPAVERMIVAAAPTDGGFIDIGVPDSFHLAQSMVPDMAREAGA